MKTGLTLEQLAAEITRQQSAKEDYVVNTGNLRLESYGPDLTLRVLDSDGADRIEPLEIGDIAHRQIGTHLSIPAKYYERMRSEDPGLLAHNVNTWLERTPAQRMIRVLDGKARAYLSNRYLRMDNYSIASAVLPILAEIPDVRIESCQITDSRMYIKAVNPRLQEDVTPGDTVQAGVVISNSEVGLGSVNIQPLIYRLVCSNGMVVNDAATKRNHIGRATDAEENFQLYSEKTLAADDHAFLLKVQDTVRAAAEWFGVSKSTVHKDVSERLEQIQPDLYTQVKEILEQNKQERHIRGGLATKRKYALQRQHEEESLQQNTP